MSHDSSDNRPVTLSVDDIERLVRKIEGLENVLQGLVDYFEDHCAPFGYIAANRMRAALSEENLVEWLREKTQG